MSKTLKQVRNLAIGDRIHFYAADLANVDVVAIAPGGHDGIGGDEIRRLGLVRNGPGRDLSKRTTHWVAVDADWWLPVDPA